MQPYFTTLCALLWAISGLLVSRGAASSLKPSPPLTERQSWNAIRRALESFQLNNRDNVVLENSTSLDTSLQDTVLFTYEGEQDIDAGKANASVSAGIEIICTTCYIKGTAIAKVIYDSDFNVSHAFDEFTTDVKEEVGNFTTEVADYIDEYFDGVREKFGDGVDLDDFDLPPMDFNFDLDLPEMPEVGLQLQFDGLEIYVQIDTVLSAAATYTLNLYTSQTAIGIRVQDDLMIGVVASIDLILSVEGEIDISSGFHLKLEDGVQVNIGMFAKEVSGLVINGGQFEFLPVTIESAGVVFKAVLRVGVSTGFEMKSPSVSIAGKDVIEISTGVQVSVFANVAEFITNVTFSQDEDADCVLQVLESYQLALGAAAGASVAVGSKTWGPVPETEIPIFYTTLAEACATQMTSSKTAEVASAVTSGAIAARAEDGDDEETTTVSYETTYAVVACQSEGLVNCPASLQTTNKFTTTKTIVTVVPTETEETSSGAVRTTVASTVPFGDGAQKILSTSGSPKSYVPPPPTSSSASESASGVDDGDDDDDDDKDKTGGVSNSVILGVSIGLGVPALIAIVAAAFLLWRRRRLSHEKEAATAGSVVQYSSLNPKNPGHSVQEQVVTPGSGRSH